METNQSTTNQNPTKAEVQPRQEISSTAGESSSRKSLVIAGVLLGFALFGISGYLLGMQQTNQESTTNNVTLPTQAPTSIVQPSPTNAPIGDSSTKLLEPSLMSMTNWQTVSFPQNIIVSQGGESRSGHVEMKIPSGWTTKTVQTRSGEGIGGGACNDFHIASGVGDTLLVIKPGCGDSNNDYLPISGRVQKVELITNKGNDGHDSYSVRYYDTSTNIYHYGSIGVSPGASIDIQKDQIYPNLVLQYEPDRPEQWLWTSYDLKYQGDASKQQTALNTIDTIISTLKLTD